MFVTSLETGSKDRLFEILLVDRKIDCSACWLKWQLAENHE